MHLATAAEKIARTKKRHAYRPVYSKSSHFNVLLLSFSFHHTFTQENSYQFIVVMIFSLCFHFHLLRKVLWKVLWKMRGKWKQKHSKCSINWCYFRCQWQRVMPWIWDENESTSKCTINWYSSKMRGKWKQKHSKSKANPYYKLSV